MSVNNEQLAELLSGIAKAQQAIIDAVERADGGWKNNHLIPLLNVAANMRQPEPRLLDLPARILLRYQGRAAVDSATIVADLERLFSQPVGATPVDAAAATAPAPPAAATAAAAPRPAAPAAPTPGGPTASASPAAPGSKL
ncbi:MAG: hypothetical protein FJY55_12340, partial [Betaproteobacteria bacterium]|nr:hypothetical protein [Betaproteobacteria bacterium]